MLPPINLKKWIDENRENLRPPVCNKQVYEMGDFIIMVIGGPNNRKDYHEDPGEEFFYQLEGDMVLRVMENGAPRDIKIREGEIFLLPSFVHHSPQRFANTVGLVIERKRAAGELDAFAWYCDACHHPLHKKSVSLQNIETDLPPIFKEFWATPTLHTCSKCGHVMQPPKKAE
jgi:3-hydroxyanthranilate 3,4-dioxygenase